jgi:integrase
MPRFHFTKQGVQALQPTAQRVDYWDTSTPGFGLRVTASGVKSWFYWYRVSPKQAKRWTIGRYPQVTLADARDQARDAYGTDPASTKSQHRDAKTFGELTDSYLRVHAKPTKRTWQRDASYLERDFAAWTHTPVKDITRKTIQTLLDTIADPQGRNAPASALAVKRLLSKMFNFALPRDFGIDFNPAVGTQAPRTMARHRFLLDPEIGQLVTALDTESANGHHLMAHWFLLILLTAQRPGEVAGMRWEQLDIFDAGHERTLTGWWNVRTSKNHQPIHAALSPEAVRVLRALRTWSQREHARLEGTCAARRGPRSLSAYVFPAGDVARPGVERPMGTDQFPATERVRDLMGMRDWTPHDLRRTASTLMGRLKVPRFIIDRVLNHTDASVGGVYDRFTYTEERLDAVTHLGAHVAALVPTSTLLPKMPPRLVEVA